ncbi:esterase/lipase family protein [Planctomycetota bacterium]
MIQDYPSSRWPTWRLVAKELLAMGAAGVLFPFGVRPVTQRTPRQRNQRTVVLLHGYLSNRSALLPLAGYLRWRGFKQVLSFNYESSQGVERAAVKLRGYLRRHVRGGRIDLVCHSLGGLVARVYLQQLGGARRVDHCITLCTPHAGTYNSYWVPSRVGRELRPDSSLIARLQVTRTGANRVRFLSVVAGSDNVVIPRVFAGHDDVIHMADVGHTGILFSPRVLRCVADRLFEGASETRESV